MNALTLNLQGFKMTDEEFEQLAANRDLRLDVPYRRTDHHATIWGRKQAHCCLTG